jgi:HD superfamily phosphohydrolase
VTKNVNAAINEINDISRQLLSRILSVLKNIEQKTEQSLTTANHENNDEITENELSALMSQRQNLINNLFNHYSQQELSNESDLLNQMSALDKKLSTSSQTCKKALANQIIKLQKRKKVKQSYQKY